MPVVQKIAKVLWGRNNFYTRDADFVQQHGRPFTRVTHVLSLDTTLGEVDELRSDLEEDVGLIIKAGGNAPTSLSKKTPLRARGLGLSFHDDLRQDEKGNRYFRRIITTPQVLLEALKERPPEEIEALFRDIMERDAATLQELGYDVSIVD